MEELNKIQDILDFVKEWWWVVDYPDERSAQNITWDLDWFLKYCELEWILSDN